MGYWDKLGEHNVEKNSDRTKKQKLYGVFVPFSVLSFNAFNRMR
ncbi:hypothetical protein H1P_1480007 [Hyella patelloides LEGE 07179]|uniref:Uncharacterized protein n=1 Tax=Hyella patelloides LEGE 07179 TaxID=945734 RepID=A0A563VLU7_9CYAN|nr:hypothetical protein H1P_1480007 [Hyella patelloides LEGE 07179]